MPMRSAIHYPNTQIESPQSMASALLLWDNLRVIVPWDRFPIEYRNRNMAEAWELIGRPLVPDDANKRQAHQRIETMIEAGVPLQIQYRDDLRPGHDYEISSKKLNPETWDLLKRGQITAAPLASGDYQFEEQAGIAIMAKLADACAGDTLARVTDKVLAYGLIADRDEPVLAQSHVVPLTLGLIDAGSIPLEKLIDFRRREASKARGGDFKALRHAYADAVQVHVAKLQSVESINQRDQLNEEFQDTMARHLENLRRAMNVTTSQLVLSPVVVSIIAAVGGFLAGDVGVGMGVGTALKGVADMFSAGINFGEKQRKAMEDNPMAYMYQLSRV